MKTRLDKSKVWVLSRGTARGLCVFLSVLFVFYCDGFVAFCAPMSPAAPALPAPMALAEGLAALQQMPPAPAEDWAPGDVFVSVGDSRYNVYSNAGIFKEQLDDGFSGLVDFITTGLAFDVRGDLWTTNFSASTLNKFSRSHPHPVIQRIGVGIDSPYGTQRCESIVFMANNDMLVGNADGNGDVLHFDAAGRFVRAYDVEREDRGSDWIELSIDQRTLFHTSEGGRIMRFDIVTNRQLPDFAEVDFIKPTRMLYAIRLLPPGDGTGGLIVAQKHEIKRMDGEGRVVQTYDLPGVDGWFSVALDPNGTSFWAGSSFFGENLFARFDIATGAVELGPIKVSGDGVGGITVKGEPRVAVNRPPAISCPAAVEGSAGGPIAIIAAVSDPDGNPLTVRWSVDGLPVERIDTVRAGTLPATGTSTFSRLYTPGVHAVGATVRDGNVEAGCETTVTVIAQQPPTIVCDDVVVECTNPSGTEATLVARVEDLDGDPLVVTWEIDGQDVETDTVSGGGATTSADVTLTRTYPIGTTEVTVSVTDRATEPVVRVAAVRVQDTIAPAVSVSATLKSLWPPDHKFEDVGLNLVIADCDPATAIAIKVFSDEDDDETRTCDGNRSPDAIVFQTAGSGVVPLLLRSERRGDSDGRVYLVVVTATDGSGNTAIGGATVTVPKSQCKADLMSVARQAAQAEATLTPSGSPVTPFLVGDGPVIGPKLHGRAIPAFIAVTPANPTVAPDAAVRLSAMGVFSDGSTRDLAETVSWNSSDAAVAAVDSTGLVTGVADGAATVTALWRECECRKPGCRHQVIQGFLGTCSGVGGFGWLCSKAYRFHHASVSGSTTVSVAPLVLPAPPVPSPAALVSLEVAPETASVPAGLPVQYAATGTFSDDTTRNLTGEVTWTSSDTVVATIGSAGRAMTLAPGSVTIAASKDGLSDTAALAVGPVAPVSLTVWPAAANLFPGRREIYQATLDLSDGAAREMPSGLVSWWPAEGDARDTFGSNHGTLQYGAAFAPGQVGQAFSFDGVNDYVEVPQSPSLTEIATELTVDAWVNPLSPSGTRAFVWSQYRPRYGRAEDLGVFLTNDGRLGVSVRSVSSPMVSSAVPGTEFLSEAGVIAFGQFQHIAVAIDGPGGTAKGYVNGQEVPLSVSSGSADYRGDFVHSGDTLTFGGRLEAGWGGGLDLVKPYKGLIDEVAIHRVALSAGQVKTLFEEVQAGRSRFGVAWASSNPAVATVLADGTVTTIAPGTTMISATRDDLSGSGTLEVLQPLQVSLSVAPTADSAVVGQTRRFNVVGHFDDGTQRDLTSEAAWTSDSPGVAAVDASGAATALAPGTATISAAGNGFTSSASMVVIPRQAVLISVTPAHYTLKAGQTLQYRATGAFNDGTSEDVTHAAAWTSDDPGIATVSSSGEAGGAAPGVAQVRASLDGAAGTAVLRVVPPLTRVVVEPPDATLQRGGLTLPYTARLDFADGTSLFALEGPPVGWWAAEGNADDNEGGHHGKFMNGASADAAGISGQAFRFDGENDFVSIPDSPDFAFGAGDFTLDAWVNFTEVKSGSFNSMANVIMGQHNASAILPNGWVFFYSGGGLGFLNLWEGNPYFVGPAPFTPVPGRWHHLAVTRTGTSFTFYADGAAVGTASSQYMPNLPDVDYKVTLGQAAGVGLIKGFIDEAEIFRRALFPQEIRALFVAGSMGGPKPVARWASTNTAVAMIAQSGLATAVDPGSTSIQATVDGVMGSTSLTVLSVTPSSLALYPPDTRLAVGGVLQVGSRVGFSDGSSHPGFPLPGTWLRGEGDLADSGSSGGAGTVTGTVGFASGQVGQAFSMSSAGPGQIVRPTSGITDSFTLDCWVKHSGTSPSVQRYFTLSGNGTDVRFGKSGSYILFSARTTAGTLQAYTTLPSVDAFHHVAAVFDGAASRFLLYVDGVLADSDTMSSGTRLAGSGLVPASPTTVTLGWTAEPMNGLIDEAEVSSIALSAAEIGGIFETGLEGLVKPVTVWTTSDPSVATVGTNGVVTAVSPGTATITATYNGVSSSMVVGVEARPRVTAVTVSPAAAQLGVDQKLQYRATLDFSDGSAQEAIVGPLAWYPGEGDASDAMGDLDGTLYSGATADAFGRIGRAFSLDGTYEAVHLPSPRIVAGTVDFWIRPGSVSGPISLFTQSSGSSPVAGSASLNQFSGEQGSVWVYDGKAWQRLAPDGTILPGRWQHLAFVYTGEAVRLYVDGVLKGATSSRFDFLSTPMGVGQRASAPVPGGWAALFSFSGLVDEFEIFARQLSQAEIQAIVARGSLGLGKPVVSWASSAPSVAAIDSRGLADGVGAGNAIVSATFEGVTGTAPLSVVPFHLASIEVNPASAGRVEGQTRQFTATLAYSDGSVVESLGGVGAWFPANGDFNEFLTGAPGTVAGTVAFDAGQVGQAFKFAKTSSGGVSKTFSGVTKAFTLSTWVNHAAAAGSEMYASVSGESCSSAIQANSGDVYFYADTMLGRLAVQGPDAPVGTFAHVAGVFDGDAGRMDLYVNGIAVGSNTFAPGTVLAKSSYPRAPVTANLFTVSGTPSLPMNGRIDEPEVYDRALSPQEIATLVALGTAGLSKPVVAWSSNDAAVASVDRNGLASAVAPGTAAITASKDGLSASGSLLVVARELLSLTVAPASARLPIGASRQCMATGAFNDGISRDLSAQVTWTSSEPSVASVSSSGLVSALSGGTAEIVATMGGFSGSGRIEVASPVTLQSVVVNPFDSGLPVGIPVQYTATLVFSDGTGGDALSASPLAWWPADGNAVDVAGTHHGTLTGGATATAPGVVGQAFRFDGVDDFVNIPGSSFSAIATAASVEMWINPEPPPQVTGYMFARRNTPDYESLSVFVRSDGKLGVLARGSVSGPAVYETAPGAAMFGVWQHVTATVNTQANRVKLYRNGVEVPVSLASGAATLSGTLPGTSYLYLGRREAASLHYKGLLDDVALYAAECSASDAAALFRMSGEGKPKPVVFWSSSAPSVASIDRLTGLASTLRGGSATITASLADGTHGTASLTVIPPQLLSIAVTPDDRTIQAGETLQYTATGTYSDGATANLTSAVSWESGASEVASVDAAGRATGLAQGATEIRATKDGVAGSALLAVFVPRRLEGIAVYPTSATLVVGERQGFQAFGSFSDGSVEDLTPEALWTSADPAVAAVDATGLVTGVAPGTARIVASAQDFTGSAGVTVTSPNPAPFLEVTSPGEFADIKSATPVLGSVQDEDLVSYTVKLVRPGQTEGRLIGSGSLPVSNGPLGLIDPTILENDLYEIRVEATDAFGQSSVLALEVAVVGNQKVGIFTLTFQDLAVPLHGVPITVTRTYDTRLGIGKDFGQGWRLDLVAGNVRKGKRHDVAVTLPDNRRAKFRFAPTGAYDDINAEGLQFGIPPIFSRDRKANYAPEPTVPQWSLRSLGDQDLIAIPTETAMATGGFGDVPVVTKFDVFYFDFTPYNPPGYVVSDQRGTEYEYAMADGGRLASVREPNGNELRVTDASIQRYVGGAETTDRIEIVRDPVSGRIARIVDPDGKEVRYSYDPAENALLQLSSSKDREGNETKYSYFQADPNRGILDKILDPRGIQAVRNEYGEDGRLLAHVDAQGERIEFDHDVAGQQEIVTDRRGNLTAYVYNDDGNVVSQTNALGDTRRFEYDAAGNETAAIDENGNVTRSTYDGRGNLLTRTDPLENVTRFVYNSLGLVTSVTDPLNRTTVNEYDADGNLTSTTDALLNVTRNFYDGQGRLTATVDVLGTRTEFGYRDVPGVPAEFGSQVVEQRVISSEGELLRKSTFTFDGAGRQRTQTAWKKDGTGTFVEYATTYTDYNANGQVTLVTEPVAGGPQPAIPAVPSTFTIYNAIGQQSVVTDRRGYQTKFFYNDRGLLHRTEFPEIDTPTGPVVPFEEIGYDEEGNRIEFRDRNGVVTTTEYDSLNRPFKTVHPDASFRFTTYDPAGRVESETDERGKTTAFGYDAAGRRTSVTDPLGHVTRFVFDAAGRQRLVIDALLHETAFEFDELGRQTKTMFPDGTSRSVEYDALGRRVAEVDEAGARTEFGYAPTGELLEVLQPDPADAAVLATRTRYEYDTLGRKGKQIDALGRETLFGYNVRNELISRTRPMGESESMAYDEQGNLASRTDFNGATTTFDYNGMNLLRGKFFPGGASQGFVYFAGSQRASFTVSQGGVSATTRFALDSRNRPAAQLNPDDTLVEWSYDAAGNRTGVRVSRLGIVSQEIAYTWTDRNELYEVKKSGTVWATYSYDEVGNRRSVTYANGTTQALEYNSKNQLTSIQNSAGAATISSYAYTVDARGLRTKVVEHTGRTVDYGYDRLGRLTEEEIAEPAGITTIGYGLDPVGNRLEKQVAKPSDPVELTSYTYNANDELETENGPDGLITYAYNANGETTQKNTVAGSVGYSWDYEGRMVGTLTPTETLAFGYDADGIRTGKSVNGVLTRFLVDKNRDYAQVLEERDVASTVQVAYVYGDDLVSQERAGSLSFYHYDGQLSVRHLSDAAATVTDSYTYDAFGVMLTQTGGTSNNYLYTGEQYDPNVGFYYLRARYFNNVVGRFVSQDSLRGGDQDPGSLHKYLYGGAEPVGRIDPSGMSGLGILGGLVLVAVLVAFLYLAYLAYSPRGRELGFDMSELDVSGIRLANGQNANTSFVKQEVLRLAQVEYARGQINVSDGRRGLTVVFSSNAVVNRDEHSKLTGIQFGDDVVIGRTSTVNVGSFGISELQGRWPSDMALARALFNTAAHEGGHLFLLPHNDGSKNIMSTQFVLPGEGTGPDGVKTMEDIVSAGARDRTFTDGEIEKLRTFER